MIVLSATGGSDFATILVLHPCSCAVHWLWSGCSLNLLVLLSDIISAAVTSRRLR